MDHQGAKEQIMFQSPHQSLPMAWSIYIINRKKWKTYKSNKPIRAFTYNNGALQNKGNLKFSTKLVTPFVCKKHAKQPKEGDLCSLLITPC